LAAFEMRKTVDTKPATFFSSSSTWVTPSAGDTLPPELLMSLLTLR